jgi:hypothetical protein
VPEHGRVNPQAPESRRFAEPREHLTEASGRERAAAFAHVALIFPEIWGFAERPEARTAASSKLDFVVSGGRCIHETPYIPHTTRLSDQRTRQMGMATPPRLDVRRCACACSVFRRWGFPWWGHFADEPRIWDSVGSAARARNIRVPAAPLLRSRRTPLPSTG